MNGAVLPLRHLQPYGFAPTQGRAFGLYPAGVSDHRLLDEREIGAGTTRRCPSDLSPDTTWPLAFLPLGVAATVAVDASRLKRRACGVLAMSRRSATAMSLEVLQEAVVRLERELPEISAVAVSADECSGGTGICILTPYRCPQRGGWLWRRQGQ